ncbi:MAG: DUF2357 domain-containing protein, partial [Leptospiraceae bacterium]|nr:DUF2357 domain-containing protein [Leptospiraceae bacterium]
MDVSAVKIIFKDSSKLTIWDANSSNESGKIQIFNDNILYYINENIHSIKLEQDSEKNLHPIQFIENIEYKWKLEISGEKEFKTSLEERNFWKPFEKKDNHGTFKVINFLGVAYFEVEQERFYFEIIPEKFHPEQFEELQKELAEFCQQLLLDWDSPTSNLMESDLEKENKVILEQYLFLKSKINPEKFDSLIELIHRNPHNTLEIEEELKPIAYGIDRNFLRQPLKYGRNWQRKDSFPNLRGFIPSQTIVTRKRETFDTPPNRFVKFALKKFQDILLLVIYSKKNNQSIFKEANILYEHIDYWLNTSYFKEIGELDKIPYNNQTLQKRVGYRDIFQIFLQVDNALKLNWEGLSDALMGTNRDVAKLYEYWVYLKLFYIIENELDFKLLNKQEADPEISNLIKINEDKLDLNLKEGKSSISVFTNKKLNLRIHLFYNRTFKSDGINYSNEKEDISKEIKPFTNSYSHELRPDITLIILPFSEEKKWSNLETKAINEGNIAYLHFDAKYRLDFKLFSTPSKDAEEDKKLSKREKNYKYSDVYKMHTYNDAIRKTIGSYVLYPGEKFKYFGKYHEILPGVGAFQMVPGNNTNPIKEFLEKVFLHHVNKFSEYYSLNFYQNKVLNRNIDVLKHTSKMYNIFPNDEKSPPYDTDVMVGYIRENQVNNARDKKVFYFYAITYEEIIKQDERIFMPKYFIGYTDKSNSTLDWYAEINNIEIVSREKIQELRAEGDEGRKDVQYYYLVNFTKIIEIEPFKFNNEIEAHRPKIIKW